MSVRGMARLGASLSVSAAFRIGGKLGLSDAPNLNTYARVSGSGSDIEFYVSSSRAITLEQDGGILHGSWNADAPLVTSDRRLKKDILPLQRTIRDAIRNAGPGKADEGINFLGGGGEAMQNVTRRTAPTASSDGALWLLRQLRPVSYSFKKGAESKYMRFGFIADELESVVPQVVRTVDKREVTDQKAVVYQDLIAVLAAASQEATKSLDVMDTRLELLRTKVTELKEARARRKKEERRRLREEALTARRYARHESYRRKRKRRRPERNVKARTPKLEQHFRPSVFDGS
jgi:hypothetical protein